MKPNFISEEQFAVMEKTVKEHKWKRVRKVPPDVACRPRHDAVTQVKASSPYKSKWEAAYANKLELEKRAGVIRQYWYEPFSIWLPGPVRYKPDFLIQYETSHFPTMEMIEIKGWSKNRRDGMTRLKIAAALFPCFTWRMAYRTKGGGWDHDYV